MCYKCVIICMQYIIGKFCNFILSFVFYEKGRVKISHFVLEEYTVTSALEVKRLYKFKKIKILGTFCPELSSIDKDRIISGEKIQSFSPFMIGLYHFAAFCVIILTKECRDVIIRGRRLQRLLLQRYSVRGIFRSLAPAQLG